MLKAKTYDTSSHQHPHPHHLHQYHHSPLTIHSHCVSSVLIKIFPIPTLGIQSFSLLSFSLLCFALLCFVSFSSLHIQIKQPSLIQASPKTFARVMMMSKRSSKGIMTEVSFTQKVVNRYYIARGKQGLEYLQLGSR